MFGWGLNMFGQTITAVASEAPAADAADRARSRSRSMRSALVITHLLRDYMKRHNWHTLGIAALLPRIFGAAVTARISDRA